MMEPFFIVGADRSGTTLLRLMLNEHSQLHVPRESWFLIDLLDALPLEKTLSTQEVDKAFEITRTHDRWSDWELSDEKLRETLYSLTAPSLAEVVDAVFRLTSEKSGHARWGDKTPGYVREIERLTRVFPRAKFIHIIRDARDVCLSLSKVGWHGRMFKDWARYWSEEVGAGMASGRRLGRGQYMEVKYERLVRESADELKRICQFLEVPFESGMLTYYKCAEQRIEPWARHLHRKATQPPDSRNIEKWRSELSGLQVLSVEAMAQETMREVGQTRKFSGPARLPCSAWRGVIRLGEWTLPARRRFGIHFPWLRGTI